jgi:hypothetical protein
MLLIIGRNTKTTSGIGFCYSLNKYSRIHPYICKSFILYQTTVDKLFHNAKEITLTACVQKRLIPPNSEIFEIIKKIYDNMGKSLKRMDGREVMAETKFVE